MDGDTICECGHLKWRHSGFGLKFPCSDCDECKGFTKKQINEEATNANARLAELEKQVKILRQDLVYVIQELPTEIKERLAWKLIDRWIERGRAEE